MEAVIVSALVLLYLLIPFALFRFVLGAFVPLREFHADDREHLTQAVVTLGFIFIFALGLVRGAPVAKSHPFPFDDSPHVRTTDYVVVMSGLRSDKTFEKNEAQFWESAQRIVWRQSRFLFWYFISVIVFASLAGWLSGKYGKWNPRFPMFRWFADVYLVRHISQWHPLLTSFVFPDPNTVVKADVLMTDGTLYSGEVAAHFVDKDGGLSGLFLVRPKRFDRPALLKEREEWGTNRSADRFWRPIPSAKIYLFGDKIVNLNLNYESPTSTRELIEKFLARLQSKPFKVTITSPVASVVRPSISK